jgi:1-deoxy-D-xylulose-5-phosphate synthase
VTTMHALLDQACDREALRAMEEPELVALAGEIRAVLLDTVTANGGHLGPNLGAVELTIALHRVFDPEVDRIVFDVGHQCYPHKLLTGRLAGFGGLRTAGGVSGYPARAESAADVMENSHASTALSYADGLASAFALSGDPARVVAVVGDGALTGGLCWEALNNLGGAGRPVVIVLNDNGRSYSPTTGSIGEHLRALRAGTASGNVFTEFGLGYLGPVDGHDVAELETALTTAATLGGPVVVHCVTRKGRGFAPAEADQTDHMHAVGRVDRDTGRPVSPARPSWTSVFSAEISRIGAERPDVVCITAAMLGPTGLDQFARLYPERTADVGISEQHALTRAAGLAMGGLHPVVAIYSTFLGRAFDQLLMDVALHRLPVTLVLDRAGVTGPDGPSHHGMWDLSMLGIVPGLRLAAPRDQANLRSLLREAVQVDGPTAVRFPKAAVGPDLPACRRVGPVDVLRGSMSEDVLIVAVGPLATACLAAAETLAGHGVGVTVADPRWVLPVPEELVALAGRHRMVLTVEDGVVSGGINAHVRQALAGLPRPTAVHALALPPRFIPHGGREDLLREFGLDADRIVAEVLARKDNEEWGS